MLDGLWISIWRVGIVLLVARKLRQSALAHLQKEGIRLAVPRQRVENMS